MSPRNCLPWSAVVAVLLFAPIVHGASPPILVLSPEGHSDGIPGLVFTPNGKQLISASRDKTICIWDVKTGELVRTLHPPIGTGQAGSLWSAAITPDGKMLAVAGHGPREGECPIYLLSLTTGQIQRVLAGHTQRVRRLAFSPGESIWPRGATMGRLGSGTPAAGSAKTY